MQVTQPLQGNAFQEIYPSFVRAGINASYILAQITATIDSACPPNGYLEQSGGGIETAGATVAVNDMLLHSWEGFLRLFPVWPRTHDASFDGLRAVGAFVVLAALRSGKLVHARIASEAGLACTIYWPWGATLKVTDADTGAAVPVKPVRADRTDRLWRFETVVGQSYVLL